MSTNGKSTERILVAGGTGRLGTRVVRLLVKRRPDVRVLTRDRSRAAHLDGTGVEVIEGDVRNQLAVRRAIAGVGTVVSAIQGFAGTKDGSPATIDRDGNRNLIQAAREAGVEHFVLVSVKDASPEHPAELMRMKYAAEQDLKASGLAWTIIQPTAYMELHCELIGRPLLVKGKTQVFGRGRNPINWVSASDVAEFVALAITDRSLRGQVIEVGGPENMTMTAFVDVFRTVTGSEGKVGHIPPVAMRLMAAAMGIVNPEMARQIQMAILMDTLPQTFDASDTSRRYPSISLTQLDEVVRRDFANLPGALSLGVSAQS
jgi:NADH dehydrogenase